MAKRRLNWTEDKIERYVKEGRGQGQRESYKPWLTIQDFPSQGRVTRSPGWKTRRLHEFMSDHEIRYFFLLDWADDVIDIREQFPLDRGKTECIAERKNIQHPMDTKTKVLIPLTTDFLITVKRDERIFNIARTVKEAAALEDERVIEKFEIEREYWQQLNIDWKIVTNLDISKTFASNIAWIYSAYWLEKLDDLNVQDLLELLPILPERISQGGGQTIQALLKNLDQEYNMCPGTFLYLFRHLLARKHITVDFSHKVIKTNEPVKSFKVNDSWIVGERKIDHVLGN